MSETLSNDQLDTLAEIINIGVGRAASVLSDLVDASVKLEVPQVTVTTLDNFHKEYFEGSDKPLASVQMPFWSDNFSGRSMLAFPPKSAAKLLNLLMEDINAGPDLDEVQQSTLNEVGNIILNGIMGSISNILGAQLKYSIPSFWNHSLVQMLGLVKKREYVAIIMIQTHFVVQAHNIEGDILIHLGASSMRSMKSGLDELRTQE